MAHRRCRRRVPSPTAAGVLPDRRPLPGTPAVRAVLRASIFLCRRVADASGMTDTPRRHYPPGGPSALANDHTRRCGRVGRSSDSWTRGSWTGLTYRRPLPGGLTQCFSCRCRFHIPLRGSSGFTPGFPLAISRSASWCSWRNQCEAKTITRTRRPAASTKLSSSFDRTGTWCDPRTVAPL